VEVGKNALYTQRFMSYQIPAAEILNTSFVAASFATGFGSDGDWIVYENELTSIRIDTVPTLTYNQLSKSIVQQYSIVFRVQACQDAHVALSEQFNNIQTRTYEIIIGGNGNQNSFIRDLGTSNEVKRVDTPGIMDCSHYKAFWVSWSDYLIRVGQGASVGHSSFLDWQDPEQRSFQGLTISTWSGITGSWDISFQEGCYFHIYLNFCSFLVYFIPLPYHNYFYANLEFCSIARNIRNVLSCY